MPFTAVLSFSCGVVCTARFYKFSVLKQPVSKCVIECPLVELQMSEAYLSVIFVIEVFIVADVIEQPITVLANAQSANVLK